MSNENQKYGIFVVWKNIRKMEKSRIGIIFLIVVIVCLVAVIYENNKLELINIIPLIINIIPLIFSTIALIFSGMALYYQHFQGPDINFVEDSASELQEIKVINLRPSVGGSSNADFRSLTNCCLVNKGRGDGVVMEIAVRVKNIAENTEHDIPGLPDDKSKRLPFVIKGKNAVVLPISITGRCTEQMEPQLIIKRANKKPLISKPLKVVGEI